MGALAGFGLLAGCLGEKTRQCDNGATCPFDEACTEVALDSGENLCGALAQVDACRGLAEFSACTFAEPDVPGTCIGNTCSACTPDLAGCTFPGWVAMTPIVTDRLRSVWVGGPTEAYAVGDHRTVLAYDGRGWQASQIVDTAVTENAPLTSVWSDTTTVYAGTNDGDGYVFAGQRVGGGLTWSKMVPGIVVNGIGGSGPTDVIAVGTPSGVPFEGAIAEYDGTSWKLVTLASSIGPLLGVHVVDAQNAWAVGANGLVLRREAGTWSVNKMSVPAEKGLTAVWGTLDTGYATSVLDTNLATSRLLQLDNGTWSTVLTLPVGVLVNLLGVWGADREAFVVGGAGTVLHFDGSQWTTPTSPTGQTNLNAIHGSARTNIIYVGDSGAIGHYTGID